MGLNYYASAPVHVALPQQPSNYFLQHQHDELGTPSYSISPSQSPPKKFTPRYPPPPSMNYLAQSSNGIAGRKRSRDEHDDEVEVNAGPVQSPKPKPDPITGPGMTLQYPDESSLNIAPKSQTGTWMEKNVETSEIVVERPRMIARKSQRRSVDESITNNATDRPDPVVMRLGIGWKQISADQASGIAGSETYIKNQYPWIKRPKIMLQHEGLGVFVVRSSPIDRRGLVHQAWIFTEDLNSCRLLCNSDNMEEVYRRLSNKRQDERGNWIPDILVDGQVISAKDSIAPLTGVTDPTDNMEVDQ